MPTPTVSRPPDTTSSEAIVEASRAGAVNGAHTVAVPRPIRSVWPAATARATTGSSTRRCDGPSRPSAGQSVRW